uniref:Uncharacterized protein n=1 Tax=Neospora caninum (strain Liverpool) TaxID=572307 RepID=A0A0F7UI92_NEOCL|nr:TPA: hypothetical protein BN1204_040710 [Neospora caninum Liverpool]
MRRPSSLSGAASLPPEEHDPAFLADFFFTQAFPLSLLARKTHSDKEAAHCPSWLSLSKGEKESGYQACPVPAERSRDSSPSPLHAVSAPRRHDTQKVPQHLGPSAASPTRLQGDDKLHAPSETVSEHWTDSMLTEQASRLTLADPETTEPARKEPFASAQEGIRLQPRPTCVACHGETAAVGGSDGVILLLRRPRACLPLLPLARVHLPSSPFSSSSFSSSFSPSAASHCSLGEFPSSVRSLFLFDCGDSLPHLSPLLFVGTGEGLVWLLPAGLLRVPRRPAVRDNLRRSQAPRLFAQHYPGEQGETPSETLSAYSSSSSSLSSFSSCFASSFPGVLEAGPALWFPLFRTRHSLNTPAKASFSEELQKLRLEGGSAGAGDPQPQEEDRLKSHRESPPEKAKEPSVTALLVCESPETSAGEEGRFAQRQSCKDEVSAFRQSATRPLILGSEQSSPDSRGAASLTSSLRPNRTPALSLFVFKGDAAGGLTRARVTFSPAASLPLSSGSSGHPLASSPPLDGALEASPRERPETEQAHPARRRGVWGTGAHAVCVEVVEEGIVLISGENTEAGRLAEPRRDASTGPVASLAFFPPSWQLSSCSRRSEQDASWDMRPEAGDDATRALKDAWFADSHSLWKGEGEEAVGGGRAEIGQRRGRPAKDLLVVSGQRRNVAVWGACGTQQLSIHPIGSRPHAGTFASVLAPDVLSPAQQTLASSGAAQGFGKDPRDASRLQTVAIFSARPGGRVWVADSNSGSVQTTLRLAPTNAASSRSSSSFAESEGRRPGASRVNGKDGEGQRKEETAASKPPREASELASGTRPALHRLSHLTGSCFLSWSTVEDTNFPCSAFSSSASETLTARKQAGAGPVCGESPRSGTSASASPPSWPETGRQPGGAEERPAPGSLRAGLDALTDTLSPTRSIASPLQPTAPQQASHLHMRDDVGLSLSSPSSRACLPPQLPTAFAGEKPAGTRALWKEDGAEHSGRRGEAVATGGALETKTEAVASSSVAERVLLVDVGKIRVRREWRLPGGAVHAAVHAHVGGLEALFLVAGPAESRGRRGSSSDGISSQQRGETATARGDRDGQARGAARERKATRDEAPDGEAAMTLGDAGASAHQRIDAPDNEERRTAEEMGTPAAGFAAVDGAEGTWLREEGRVGVALDDRCFLLCTLAFGEHKRVVATQLLSALGAAFPAEAHAWRTPGGRRPSLSETSRETHRIGRECPDATRRSGGLQTGTGFQAGFPENGGAWRHDSIRPEEPCPGLTRRTPSPDRPSSFPLSAPLPLPVSVSLEAFDSDPENETLFLSSPSVLVDQGGPENRRRDRDDSAGGVGFLGSNAHWNGHLIRLPPPLVSSSCSSSFYALSPPSPILDSCNLRIQDLSLSLTGWTEAALAYCLAYAVDESALLSDWSIPAVFLRSRRFAPARASSHNLGQERGGPSDLSSPFSPFSSSSFPLPSHALPLSSPTASRAGRGDVSPLDALKNRDSGVSFSTSSSGRRPSAVPEGSLAELASRRAHAVLRFLLPLIRVAAPMLEMPLFSSVSVSAAQARSGLEFNSPLRGLRTDQREAESRSWKGGETRENVQEVGGKTAESAGFQEGEKRQEGGVLETSRRWGVEHRVGHHAGGQKADRCESTSRGPEVSLFFCPSFFRTYFAPQGCTAPVPGDSFFAAQTYLPVSVKETTVSSSVPLSSFLSLLRHFAATVEALEALTCATVASAASFPLRNFPPARPVSASRVRQRVACQPHTPKTRSSSASSSSSLSPEVSLGDRGETAVSLWRDTTVSGSRAASLWPCAVDPLRASLPRRASLFSLHLGADARRKPLPQLRSPLAGPLLKLPLRLSQSKVAKLKKRVLLLTSWLLDKEESWNRSRSAKMSQTYVHCLHAAACVGLAERQQRTRSRRGDQEARIFSPFQNASPFLFSSGLDCDTDSPLPPHWFPPAKISSASASFKARAVSPCRSSARTRSHVRETKGETCRGLPERKENHTQSSDRGLSDSNGLAPTSAPVTPPTSSSTPSAFQDVTALRSCIGQPLASTELPNTCFTPSLSGCSSPAASSFASFASSSPAASSSSFSSSSSSSSSSASSSSTSSSASSSSTSSSSSSSSSSTSSSSSSSFSFSSSASSSSSSSSSSLSSSSSSSLSSSSSSSPVSFSSSVPSSCSLASSRPVFQSAEDGALGQAEVQCAGEAEISNVETKPLDDAAALFSASREMHAHRDDLRGPEPAPREGPRNASVAFPREGSDPGVSAGGLLHTVAAASHAATTALLGAATSLPLPDSPAFSSFANPLREGNTRQGSLFSPLGRDEEGIRGAWTLAADGVFVSTLVETHAASPPPSLSSAFSSLFRGAVGKGTANQEREGGGVSSAVGASPRVPEDCLASGASPKSRDLPAQADGENEEATRPPPTSRPAIPSIGDARRGGAPTMAQLAFHAEKETRSNAGHAAVEAAAALGVSAAGAAGAAAAFAVSEAAAAAGAAYGKVASTVFQQSAGVAARGAAEEPGLHQIGSTLFKYFWGDEASRAGSLRAGSSQEEATPASSPLAAGTKAPPSSTSASPQSLVSPKRLAALAPAAAPSPSTRCGASPLSSQCPGHLEHARGEPSSSQLSGSDGRVSEAREDERAASDSPGACRSSLVSPLRGGGAGQGGLEEREALAARAGAATEQTEGGEEGAERHRNSEDAEGRTHACSEESCRTGSPALAPQARAGDGLLSRVLETARRGKDEVERPTRGGGDDARFNDLGRVWRARGREDVTSFLKDETLTASSIATAAAALFELLALLATACAQDKLDSASNPRRGSTLSSRRASANSSCSSSSLAPSPSPPGGFVAEGVAGGARRGACDAAESRAKTRDVSFLWPALGVPWHVSAASLCESHRALSGGFSAWLPDSVSTATDAVSPASASHAVAIWMREQKSEPSGIILPGASSVSPRLSSACGSAALPLSCPVAEVFEERDALVFCHCFFRPEAGFAAAASRGRRDSSAQDRRSTELCLHAILEAVDRVIFVANGLGWFRVCALMASWWRDTEASQAVSRNEAPGSLSFARALLGAEPQLKYLPLAAAVYELCVGSRGPLQFWRAGGEGREETESVGDSEESRDADTDEEEEERHFNDVFGEEEQSHRTVGFGAMESGDEKAQGAPVGRESETEEGARETFERDTVERRGERLEDGEQETPRRGRGRGRLDGVGEAENQPEMTVERGTLTATVEIPSVWRKPRETGSNFQERTCGASAKKRHSNHVLLSTKRTLVSSAGSSAHLSVVQRATVTSQIEILATACVAAFPAVLPWNVLAWIFRGAFSVQKRMVKEGEEATLWRGTPRGRATSLPAVLEREVLFNSPDGVWVRLVSHLLGAAGFADEATLERPRDAGEHTRRTTQRDTQSLSFLYAVSSGGSQRRADLSSSSFRASVSSGACLLFLPLAGLQLFRRYLARLRCSSSLPRLRLPGLQSLLALQAHFHLLGLSAHARRETHFPSLCRNSSSFSPNGAESHSSRPSHRIVPPSSFAASASDSPHQQKETGGERIRTSNHPEHSQECSDTSTQLLPSSGSSLDAAVLSHSRESASPAWCASQPLPGRASPHFWGPECSGGFDGEAAGSVGAFMSSLVEDAALASSNLENPMLLHPFSREVPEPTSQDSARASSRGCAAGTPPSVSSSRSTSPPRDSLASLPSFAASSVASAFGSFAGSASVSFAHSTGERSRAPALGQETQTDGPRERREAQEQLGDAQVSEQGETGGTDLERPICVRGRDGDSGEQEGNSENLVPGRRPDRETDVEKELAALFSLLEAALSLGSALHVCRLLSRHILPRLLASLVPSTSSASPFRPSSVSLPWMNNGKSGSAFSRDERQGLTAAELSRGSKEGGREGEGERDALSESGRLEGSGREEESKAADSARASKSESRQTGRSVAEGVSHAGEGRVCENREEHGKRAREILQVCLLRCAAFLAEGLAQTSFLPQSQEGDERRNREARSRGERSGEEERGSDGGGTQQESAGGVSSGFSSLSVAAEELETNATSGKGAVYPCSLSSSAQTKTPSGLSLDEVVNCFFLLHAALQALEARREESVTTARGKEGVNPARDETETASQAPCRANVRPADLVLLLLAASACHPGLAAFTATNRACERGNETRKETRTEGTREGEREQDSGGVGEGRDLHPKQRGKGGEAENRERSPPRRRREMSRTLFPADGEDASEAGDLSGWRVAVRGDSEETEEAREGREEQTLFRERQNAPTSDTSPPQSALHVAFFSHASRGAPRGAYRASPLNDRTPPSSVLSCAFSPVASSSSSSSRWSPTESRDVFDDAEKSGSEFSCEDARGSAGTQDDESRAGEPPAETPESLLEVLLAPPSSDPLRSLLERSSAFFKERGEGEDRSAREVQGERGARSERGRQDAGREETEADDEKMMEGKTADGEGRCKAEANRERRCACEVDKHSSECMQIVDWARGCFGPPSPCRHFAMATLLKLLERRASGGSSVHHTLGSSPSPWFSRAPQFLDAEKEACVLGDGKAGGDGEDKSDERDGGIALLTPEPVQRAVAIPVSVHLAFLSRAHALLAAISSHQRLHVASASKDRGVEEQGSADRGKTVRLVPDPGVLDLLTCVQKRAGPMPSPASENVAPIPSGEERFVSRSRNEEECFASPGGNGETVRREALCRRPVCSASSAFLLPAADAPGKTSSVPFFLSPISPSHAAPGDFWRLLSGLALAARGREPPWLLPAAADAARFASEDSHAEGELNLRAWGDGRGLRGGAQPDSFSRQSGGQRSSLRDSQLLAGALATLEAPRAPRPCDGVCGASEGQGDLFPAEECLYTGKADQPSTPGESVPGGPARKDELRRDLRVAASWQTQRAAAHSASSPLSQGSAAAFAPSQPLGAKGVFSGGGACVRGVGKAHRGPFPREGEPGCEPWAKLHAAVGGKGAALPLGVSESAESSERFLIRRKEALQDLAVRSRCDRRLPQRGANLESSTVAALAALEETMQKKWNRSFATREGEFHAAPREDAKVRQEREGSERKAIEKNTRERKKGTREERKEKERAEKNEETELSGDELPFGSPGRRGVCGDTAEENGKSGTGEQVRTAHPVPVSSRQSSERSSLTSPSPGNGQTRHVFSHPLA